MSQKRNVSDTLQFKAIGGNTEYAKFLTQEAANIVRDLLIQQVKSGVELPPEFPTRISHAVFNRLKPVILKAAWYYLNAGIKTGLSEATQFNEESKSLPEVSLEEVWSELDPDVWEHKDDK